MSRRRGPPTRPRMSREAIADEIESIVYANDGGIAIAVALGWLCRRLRERGPDVLAKGKP